jgi:hypothetical protein
VDPIIEPGQMEDLAGRDYSVPSAAAQVRSSPRRTSGSCACFATGYRSSMNALVSWGDCLRVNPTVGSFMPERSRSQGQRLKSTIVLATLQQALPQKDRPRARIQRRRCWRDPTTWA